MRVLIASAFAFVALVTAGIVTAKSAGTTADACPTNASVVEDYYAGYDAFAYAFTGPNAAKIVAFFTDLRKAAPPHPVNEVWVGVAEDGLGDWFFFYADTCSYSTAESWKADNIAAALDALGIDLPVGPTFHQLPGSPGAPPGVTTQGI